MTKWDWLVEKTFRKARPNSDNTIDIIKRRDYGKGKLNLTTTVWKVTQKDLER